MFKPETFPEYQPAKGGASRTPTFVHLRTWTKKDKDLLLFNLLILLLKDKQEQKKVSFPSIVTIHWLLAQYSLFMPYVSLSETTYQNKYNISF